MGILDAPAADFRGKSLATLLAARDVPNVVARWRADELTVANGAAIPIWADSTGGGSDLYQGTAAAQPTLVTAGPNGHKSVAFAAGQYISAPNTFSAAGWQKRQAAIAQPLTVIMVAKLKTPVGAALRTFFGSGVTLISEAGTGNLRMYAGTSGAYSAGPPPVDDQWHVFVAAFGTGMATLGIDGIVSSTAITQNHGTSTLDRPVIGAGTNTGSNAGGPFEVADLMIVGDYLTPDQWAPISKALAATYGITQAQTSQISSAPYQELLDATTSQTARVWLPRNVTSASPLYIWSHQQSGSRGILPGYFAYSAIHALVNEGFIVVASDNGGTDGWTGPLAVQTVQRIQSYIVPTIVPGWTAAGAKTILHGISMGGGLSAYLAGSASLTNVKGVILEDAAVNLDWMYNTSSYQGSITTGLGLTQGTLSAALASTGQTSIPTTASFPTTGTQIMIGNTTANREIVTTTGPSTGTAVPVTATAKTHASGEYVSDYPTKAAGRDPSLFSASAFGTTPFLVLASTADPTVPPANNSIPFLGLLTNAAELLTKIGATGGHLSQYTLDIATIIPFVRRCLAR